MGSHPWAFPGCRIHHQAKLDRVVKPAYPNEIAFAKPAVTCLGEKLSRPMIFKARLAHHMQSAWLECVSEISYPAASPCPVEIHVSQGLTGRKLGNNFRRRSLEETCQHCWGVRTRRLTAPGGLNMLRPAQETSRPWPKPLPPTLVRASPLCW